MVVGLLSPRKILGLVSGIGARVHFYLKGILFYSPAETTPIAQIFGAKCNNYGARLYYAKSTISSFRYFSFRTDS